MPLAALHARSIPSQLSIDVATYHAMAEDGRLDPDARVELLEGAIVPMPPIGHAHANIVDELAVLAITQAPRGTVRVRVQGPLRLDAYSEPQPDIAILRGPADAYRTRHPTAADVLLLLEVADSSLRDDRMRKMPLYARHGIPEVWLVNLVDRVVEVHRAPLRGTYMVTEPVRTGLLRPALTPEVAIELDRLFG